MGSPWAVAHELLMATTNHGEVVLVKKRDCTNVFFLVERSNCQVSNIHTYLVEAGGIVYRDCTKHVVRELKCTTYPIHMYFGHTLASHIHIHASLV